MPLDLVQKRIYARHVAVGSRSSSSIRAHQGQACNLHNSLLNLILSQSIFLPWSLVRISREPRSDAFDWPYPRPSGPFSLPHHFYPVFPSSLSLASSLFFLPFSYYEWKGLDSFNFETDIIYVAFGSFLFIFCFFLILIFRTHESVQFVVAGCSCQQFLRTCRI